MALELKRMIHPYECLKCQATGELLVWGDYYYEDDIDGFIVGFNYYHDTKEAMKKEQASHAIEYALTMEEHKQRMKQAEKEFLNMTIFDRPLKANNLFVQRPPEPRGDNNA